MEGEAGLMWNERNVPTPIETALCIGSKGVLDRIRSSRLYTCSDDITRCNFNRISPCVGESTFWLRAVEVEVEVEAPPCNVGDESSRVISCSRGLVTASGEDGAPAALGVEVRIRVRVRISVNGASALGVEVRVRVRVRVSVNGAFSVEVNKSNSKRHVVGSHACWLQFIQRCVAEFRVMRLDHTPVDPSNAGEDHTVAREAWLLKREESRTVAREAWLLGREEGRTVASSGIFNRVCGCAAGWTQVGEWRRPVARHAVANGQRAAGWAQVGEQGWHHCCVPATATAAAVGAVGHWKLGRRSGKLDQQPAVEASAASVRL
jgi:hypothetical protein